MDSFWADKLSQGETIEKEFSVGKRFIKASTIIGVVIGVMLLPLFGFGLLFIAVGIGMWFIMPFKHRYVFTNKRVLLADRWLTTKLTSINLDQITDVHVRTTATENWWYKTGTLALETAGKYSETVIKHVENPYQLMQKLNELRDKAKYN